jgi:hypothetical protein
MISARPASEIPVLDDPFGLLSLDLLLRVQGKAYADTHALIVFFVTDIDLATVMFSDCSDNKQSQPKVCSVIA